MHGAALVVLIVVLAGCGSNPAAETTPQEKPARVAAAQTDPGARAVDVVILGDRSLTAARLDAADLVVVPWNARRVAATVRRHPSVHFVLVGRSYEEAPGPNVAGILFREDEAAYLAGVVAGLVTAREGAVGADVAWVGGKRKAVADAFERGVHSVDGGAAVIRAWAENDATLCKEAALDAIARGASVILTGRGRCADGALAGAADQNAVGLTLDDFERRSVAVDQFVRDARDGRYHGGENVVFGTSTGAVGVGRLGSRVPPDAVAQARMVEQELAAGLRSARGPG
jgi:basic membrane lipoprotein Med (substrate-binding protein (PBP1-ABC) superfamily)